MRKSILKGFCMRWNDYIELICNIISTLSVIFSALVISHHFLQEIEIRAVYENEQLILFAYALARQQIIKKMEIKHKKKLLNLNDSFFSNGERTIKVKVNEIIILKKIDLAQRPKIIKLKITLNDNHKIYMICFVR